MITFILEFVIPYSRWTQGCKHKGKLIRKLLKFSRWLMIISGLMLGHKGIQNKVILKRFVNSSSEQSLSRVWLFVTQQITAYQSSLSITNSQSLLKLMSIQLVMPSNHLILCRLLLLLPSIFRSIRVFSMSQFFALGGQSIGISASASVLPMNIQDLFPLGWTGWISLHSKKLSWVFSNTTVQKHQFLGAQHFL